MAWTDLPRPTDIRMFKGAYGSATLTLMPDHLLVKLHRSDGVEMTERFVGCGPFGEEFGVHWAASAVAHGVDEELCQDEVGEICRHVEVS